MTTATAAGAPTGAPAGAPATGPQSPDTSTSEHGTGWACTVQIATGTTTTDVVDDDTAATLLDALASRAGAVSVLHPADGEAHPTGGVVVSMTFDVTDTEQPDAAGAAAVTIARDAMAKTALPAGDVLELSVLTWAEQARRNDEPATPELVGVSEVVDMLAVSRQRVDQLRARPDSGFPRPVVVLRAGPIWSAPAIRAFVESWDRSPGRRPRAKTAATS